GWMKMDLVVGTIGKYGAAHRLVPSVLSIQGTTTYSGIANRIIGRGNYTWKSALVELEPAWDATLEDDVKEDPKLAANAPYSYVGTLYRIPTDIYPFDLAGSNEDGSDADPRPKGFSMQLHTRVGLEVEGEPDLENDPWQPLKVGYKMPETLEDEDLKDLPMDRRTKYHFRAGNFRYIRFDGPMTHEYYTPEQQAQVDAGTEDVEKTVVYMQVRAQAIEIGGRVQADSGHQGNYPYQVTRFVEARQAKVIEDDAERVEPNDTGGLTVITQKKTRSDYRALRSYVDKLAERVARPDEGYNVVMPYLHMGQLLGVEINRILSSEGDLMESGLEWSIAGGSRDFFGQKTSLLLSDSFYQLQAGASIMFAGGK
ncbi:MAG: hypothetical protein KC978_20425, partial [Candidatus Omnitrophica bacterium]|nr:hypothetical protein [Candidatus Omnitrophota bacterium]